jgi:hypothetical protein
MKKRGFSSRFSGPVLLGTHQFRIEQIQGGQTFTTRLIPYAATALAVMKEWMDEYNEVHPA